MAARIEFRSKSSAVAGVIGGAVIAVGGTLMTLQLGGDLGGVAQGIIILAAIGIGAGITVVSVFFGMVVPSVSTGHSQVQFNFGRWNMHSSHKWTASGPTASEVRELPNFDQVEVTIAGSTVVSVGGPPRITLEAPKDALSRIITEVVDGRLHITAQGWSAGSVKAIVSTPSLRGVGLRGSGDMSINGIQSDAFSIDLQGSGDIEASGECRSLTVAVMGSGSVGAEKLKTQTVEVAVHGSGGADLNVEKELHAKVLGSGDITYRGQPRVSKSVLGSGSIKAD